MTDNAQRKIEDKEYLQKATTDMLAYPEDIGSQGESKYTIFNIYQYKKSQVNKAEFITPLGSIVLPIPPELNNTDSLNYEEFSAPLIQAGFAWGSAESLGSAFSSLGGAASVVGKAFIDKLPGGENAINQINAITGASVNPKNTNVFKNPTAREHRYTFKMIAKSPQESIAIRKIVNKFRYHAYPSASKDNEIIYLSPDLFQIRFKVGKESSDDKDSFLFHPLPSALVALSVSYNGNATPTFFRNSGAPVEVIMQLVFREMELDNKEKLLSRYNVVGTAETKSASNNIISRPFTPTPNRNTQTNAIENRFNDFGDAIL